MFRVTLHLLLIAGLLVCPLRCFALGEATAPESLASTASLAAAAECGTCSCCQPAAPELPAGEPVEGCPCDNCDCGSCICNGALAEQGSAQPVDSVDCVSLFVSAADFNALTRPRFVDQQVEWAGIGWGYPSGRAARIAHQSLLN